MVRFLLNGLRARVRAGAICVVGMAAFAISTSAWSLGLGEIELQSALNEEFDATIELLDAGDLQAAEVLVSLATTEDFKRVGVERFFFLTDLKFAVSISPGGSAEVQITSSRPVTEPYLNFLVQILWPNGRLLKEYTVLLDPPTFSAAAAPAVRAPAQDRSAASSGQVQRAPASGRSGDRVQLAPAGAPVSTSRLDDGVVGDEYRMTDRDDTLWSIASRTKASGAVSVNQQMLAIQSLNPDAFINGNINLLKAGYTLRLPDDRQAQALPGTDALAEVARQNEQWRAIARGERPSPRDADSAPAQVAAAPRDSTSSLRSPVDATRGSQSGTAPRQTDGELKIIAEDGDSAVGVADASGTGQVPAAVLEENDRLAREVEQLASQLDREKDLASDQIAVKERQLEVRDQQIAELQAQLAAARDNTGTQPVQSQNQSAAAQPEQAWWESPLVMYGGVGALVLLLVGGMIAYRRRREEETYFPEEEFSADERTEPAFERTSTEEFEPEVEDADELADGAERQSAAEEVPDSETSDVIGEADIYIAYGRYPQAIGLLLGVLEEDASRNDVRLKLLEIFAETSDRAAFDDHLTQLIEHCDEEDALLEARDLEARFGEGAISLDEMIEAPDAENTETLEAPAAGAAVEARGRSSASTRKAADEAADLSFADELDADPQPAEPDGSASNQKSLDRPIDFELELDEDSSSDNTETSGSGDELGGDLGIDFNPDRTAKSGSDDEIPELEDLEIESSTDGDEINLDDHEEFDFDDEGDSANTKLDLARAYIDMGDAEGARDILREVIDEGSSEQQQRAQSMLEAL